MLTWICAQKKKKRMKENMNNSIKEMSGTSWTLIHVDYVTDSKNLALTIGKQKLFLLIDKPTCAQKRKTWIIQSKRYLWPYGRWRTWIVWQIIRIQLLQWKSYVELYNIGLVKGSGSICKGNGKYFKDTSYAWCQAWHRSLVAKKQSIHLIICL